MWFDSAGWGVTPAAAGVAFSVSSSFSPFLRCELRCLRNLLLASRGEELGGLGRAGRRFRRPMTMSRPWDGAGIHEVRVRRN
jgi:hypothetical protein